MTMIDMVSLQYTEICTIKKCQTHRDLGTRSADL